MRVIKEVPGEVFGHTARKCRLRLVHEYSIASAAADAQSGRREIEWLRELEKTYEPPCLSIMIGDLKYFCDSGLIDEK